jgi:hypothetical protein
MGLGSALAEAGDNLMKEPILILIIILLLSKAYGVW